MFCNADPVCIGSMLHGLHEFGDNILGDVILRAQLWGSSGHCPRTHPDASTDSLGAGFGAPLGDAKYQSLRGVAKREEVLAIGLAVIRERETPGLKFT